MDIFDVDYTYYLNIPVATKRGPEYDGISPESQDAYGLPARGWPTCRSV